MDKREQLIDVRARMEDLLDEAGLRRFDRCLYSVADHEATFLWEPERLAVVVELAGGAPTEEELAAQLIATFASSVN